MPPHLAGGCGPVPSLVWVLLGDKTRDDGSLSIGHDLKSEKRNIEEF